ncbi:hypothetical protein [Pseudomonas sp. MF7448]|uniref:hypothetical protein n=1 Tax=Pseudomonas sp. MF7448 TaxID=2797537 RepID=UPI00190C736F|nr:hypothetical protein [Pseudomonas sp. MF7448]MBK3437484.1 hypothetical protein [Pseudomonas sp. MF7448]
MFGSLASGDKILLREDLITVMCEYDDQMLRAIMEKGVFKRIDQAAHQGLVAKANAVLYVQLLTGSPSIRASVKAHRDCFVAWFDTDPPLDPVFMSKIYSLETLKYDALVASTPIWNAIAQADSMEWAPAYTQDQVKLLEMLIH